MDNIYLQGLSVSLIGLFVTFLSLGVFILIMVGLQRIFPYREEVEVEEGGEEAEALTMIQVEDADEEGAVAAAIAAALSYFSARNESQLGECLKQGRSAWWASRRMEARTGNLQKR